MADMVNVRRTSGHSFRERPQVRIGRSQFNRSHGLKTTFDASYLYPILVDEVLPGDTFTLKMNGFCRIFSPLDAPIMDNIEVETFFFYIPTRLLWSNWEYFQGAHDAAGAQDTDYTIPIMGAGLTVATVAGASGAARLAAHLGLPEGLDSSNCEVSALPFRAYSRVWNEWFRDQNILPELTENTGNGPDTVGNYVLKKRAKKHDYFTSCLPYLQKGEDVTIPFAGQAEIWYNQDVGGEPTIYLPDNDPGFGGPGYYRLDTDTTRLDVSATSGLANNVLYAELSTVTGGFSINALRQSVAIQRLLETDARSGTRYTEILKAHFGVTAPDYRLQRPEYLGGGKSYINVSEVANTSATATEDQGELRGIGRGTISGHGFAKSFVEHGYILGLICARGDLTYQKGVDRMWTRQTRYDFYMPALANLGEQSVLNKEIYVSNVPATDDAVFGYQERWAEYRFAHSRLAGLFRSDAAGSLDFWHLSEDFASLPALNSTFIEDQTPMSRVTVVDTADDFILDAWFDYKCARPLPVFSVPSLTARF